MLSWLVYSKCYQSNFLSLLLVLSLFPIIVRNKDKLSDYLWQVGTKKEKEKKSLGKI